jgi:hypothetical protein
MIRILLFYLLFFSPLFSYSQSAYQLVPDQQASSASCQAYRLADKNKKTIPLPVHIQEYLKCSSVLDLYGALLTYMHGDTIKQYHIKNGREISLLVLPDSIDGVSGPTWSPDHRQLLFVIINQQQSHGYTKNCRIIYIALRNGAVARKRKFDCDMNFHCGSTCTAQPYKDFFFARKGTLIQYRKRMPEDGGNEKPVYESFSVPDN